MKAVSKIRLTDVILAVIVYLPLLNSHCTKNKFMFLVSCRVVILKFTRVCCFAWPGRTWDRILLLFVSTA